MKDVKQKTKPADTDSSVFSIEVTLPNRNYARFTYSNFELADAHYVQLQATQVVGGYGIKAINRSWKK